MRVWQALQYTQTGGRDQRSMIVLQMLGAWRSLLVQRLFVQVIDRMLDAVAVANFFVAQAAGERLRDMNPPKLHGLTYCAHGWHLAMLGKPLVEGQVMATVDGPRIDVLGDLLSGTKRVMEPLVVRRTDANSGKMVELTPHPQAADEGTRRVLSITWKAYGKLSGYDLSLVTREQGGPWDLLWNDEERSIDRVAIPNETIRMWFRQLAERNRKVTSAKSVKDTQRILIAPQRDGVKSV